MSPILDISFTSESEQGHSDRARTHCESSFRNEKYGTISVSSILLVTDLSSLPFERLNDSGLMKYLGLAHSSEGTMQKNINEKSKECDSFPEISVFLNEIVLSS